MSHKKTKLFAWQCSLSVFLEVKWNKCILEWNSIKYIWHEMWWKFSPSTIFHWFLGNTLSWIKEYLFCLSQYLEKNGIVLSQTSILEFNRYHSSEFFLKNNLYCCNSRQFPFILSSTLILWTTARDELEPHHAVT